MEEFLQLVPLHGRTTGKIVCDATLNCLASTGLDLLRLVSITTDGAPAMVGKERGAASLLQKHCADAGNVHKVRKLHCIIHQEALCAKAATLTEVMSIVVKIMNSVLASSMNHRLFHAFQEEVDAHYGDLIYFCEVRWLSCGKMFELRAELVDFLAECNLPSADLLADSKWLAKLALLTDVTEQLNDLNQRLQGKNIIVMDMFAIISSFEAKLRLWEAQLSKQKPTHFKRLAACESKDIDFAECESVITMLRGEFASRFKGFPSINLSFWLCGWWCTWWTADGSHRASVQWRTEVHRRLSLSSAITWVSWTSLILSTTQRRLLLCLAPPTVASSCSPIWRLPSLATEHSCRTSTSTTFFCSPLLPSCQTSHLCVLRNTSITLLIDIVWPWWTHVFLLV